jgi:hypothetical protein
MHPHRHPGDRIRGMSQDVQFLWTCEARRMEDRRSDTTAMHPDG